MELDQDTHICLSCQETIVGLENYVHHKKVECPARKQTLDKSKDTQTDVLHHSALQQSSDELTDQAGQTDHLLSYSHADSLEQGVVDPTTGLDSTVQTPQYGGFTPTVGGFSPLSQSLPFGSPPSQYSRSGPHGILSPPQSGLSPPQGGLGSGSQVLPPISQHGSLVGLTSPSRGLTSMQSQHQQSGQADNLGVEVSEAVASLVANTLSPTSNRTIDPNMVLYGNNTPNRDATDFMSFFSSLELQSKWTFDGAKGTDKGGESSKVDELDDDRLDHQKALRIASILNELAFSSDSEDFQVPSDAEDFLNSDNDVGDEVEDGDDEEMGEQNVEDYEDHPPRTHTGGKWKPENFPPPTHTSGKWKPSSKLQAMREARDEKANARPPSPPKTGGKTGGKWGYKSPPKTGGKWRPGQRLTGKWRPGMASSRFRKEESEDEEDEEIDNENDPDYEVDDDDEEDAEHQRRSGKGGKVHFEQPRAATETVEAVSELQPVEPEPEPEPVKIQCHVCNKTLFSEKSYKRHLTSKYHYKRANPQAVVSTKRVKEEEPIECTICQKCFDSKYNFARHLASSYHMHRSQMCNKTMLLDESCQVLLLRQSRFQCHVCSFYCSQANDLLIHMRMPLHIERARQLLCPLLCVRCKFQCRSNEQMLEHIASREHQMVHETATRPCVMKEVRYKIKCPQCEQVLHSSAQFRQHLKNKHEHQKGGIKAGQRPFCPYCGKRWGSLFAMAIHIRRKHTKEKPFKCNCCSAAFADKYSLTMHNKSQRHINRMVEAMEASRGLYNYKQNPTTTSKKKEKEYKCNHCEFKCLEYCDLRPHYIECHANELHICEACGVTFVEKKAYQVHMKSRLHLQSSNCQESGIPLHACKHCGKTYNSNKLKQLHELTHNHILTEAAAKKIDTHFGISHKYHRFLDSLSGVGPTVQVTCPECGKAMSKQNSLPHLRSHTQSTPFKCMLCDKAFNSPLSLRRHLMYHLDIRTHVCTDCGVEYMKKTQLEQHKLTRHTPNAEKKFACEVCNETFVMALQLKRHRLVHSEKLHKCPVSECRYASHAQADMTIHIATHMTDRPFLCDECGWSAKTKKSLVAHRRTHTGERKYHCEYCEYKATTKHHLHRHMRIHIGSKPYKCPYCEYTCNTLDNLQKHVAHTGKHSGLYLYVCQACTYGSNIAKEYKDHMFNVHNIEEKDIGLACTAVGIYNQSSDLKKVPEGGCVLPVKERMPRGKKEKKEKKKKSENEPKKPKGSKRGRKQKPKEIIENKTPEISHEIVVETAPMEQITVTRAEDGTLIENIAVTKADDGSLITGLNMDHCYVSYVTEADGYKVNPEVEHQTTLFDPNVIETHTAIVTVADGVLQ